MSEIVPESVKPYFGHDKVALFGAGGMPAAPPAPPGSPARRQGEVARADALSKVGTDAPRVGARPAVKPPRPAPPRLMRLKGERALMAASMRELARRETIRPPAVHAGVVWDRVFVPVYRRIPWPIKRRMVGLSSGVRRWRT